MSRMRVERGTTDVSRRLPGPPGNRSVRRLRKFAPVTGRDADDRLIATVSIRSEHDRFALANVEPDLAESIENIRLVRDHDEIGAWGGRRCDCLAQRRSTPVVLDRRDHEPAFGVVGRSLDIAETHQRARFDRTLEQAGTDLADRDPELVNRLPYRLRECSALVVELALLDHVPGIERVGVGLVLVGCAMAENDHKAAVA